MLTILGPVLRESSRTSLGALRRASAYAGFGAESPLRLTQKSTQARGIRGELTEQAWPTSERSLRRRNQCASKHPLLLVCFLPSPFLPARRTKSSRRRNRVVTNLVTLNNHNPVMANNPSLAMGSSRNPVMANSLSRRLLRHRVRVHRSPNLLPWPWRARRMRNVSRIAATRRLANALGRVSRTTTVFQAISAWPEAASRRCQGPRRRSNFSA